MTISLIVAVSDNNVIGKNNTLPWSLPDDLKHFRDVTKGHTVVMGRKTYESIGHPLPNRRNIVISTTSKKIDGCEVFTSLGEALMALSIAKDSTEIFIIGGARMYEEALMEILGDLTVHRIYLTRVHANIEGDVFFPNINWKHWKEISSEKHEKDDRHEYPFTFLVYENSKK